MKKIGMFVLFAVAAAVAGRGVAPVHAFPEFKKEFENKYVKEEPATDAEEALKEAAERPSAASATSIRRRTRRIRNTYGKAISKHIAGRDRQEGA